MAKTVSFNLTSSKYNVDSANYSHKDNIQKLNIFSNDVTAGNDYQYNYGSASLNLNSQDGISNYIYSSSKTSSLIADLSTNDLNNNVYSNMSVNSAFKNTAIRTGATAAVGAISIANGVLRTGEHIIDGGAWIASKVVSLFGGDPSVYKEFIEMDLVGDASDAFYNNTKLGRALNEASYMKYDSDAAKKIEKGSEVVTTFALATAATAATGGAASVVAPTVLGFSYGAGKKAQSTYSEKGINTSFKDEAGIFIAGVGEAASWYAKGKLGQGATNLIKTISENGAKATGSYLASGVKSTLAEVKSNEVLNTVKGIVGKEQLASTLKKSLLQGDNIADSVGVIGNNVADWVNGDKEFNAKTVAQAGGELVATMGANLLFDSASDYLGALKNVSHIDVDSVDNAFKGVSNNGTYVEEAALFDGSSEKKGFLSKMFNKGSVDTPKLSTEDRILRDRINTMVKETGGANITFNSTKEISTDMLRSVDDLSNVNVRINGGFNDLDGNFKAKYNDAKYIDRITYNGYEALEINARLDDLQSKVDMSLPTKERAEQIYNILSDEIPPMRDYNQYPEGHKVSASLRGLTATNDVGKEGLVCAGYSQAYKELCGRCGIECDYIRGKGITDPLTDRGGGHAWNVVVDGDEVIPVDVTWKACNAGEWFGKSDNFAATHIADSDEIFRSYSQPKNSFDDISQALDIHSQKYGSGEGLKQLRQYANDGNINHITSTGGAREAIRNTDPVVVKKYVDQQTYKEMDYVTDVMSKKFGSNEARQRMIMYITPGNEHYGNINLFTSAGGARGIMKDIDPSYIEAYLKRGR